MTMADASAPQRRIELRPQRSALGASRVTLAALLFTRPSCAEEALRRVRDPHPGPAVPFVLRVSLRLPEDRPRHRWARGDRGVLVRDRACAWRRRAFHHVPRCAVHRLEHGPGVWLHARDRRSRTGTVPHLVGGSREGPVWDGSGAHFGCDRLAHRLSRPCRRRGGQHLASLVDHRYARAAVVHSHGITRPCARNVLRRRETSV